jgi:hypothetical protein
MVDDKSRPRTHTQISVRKADQVVEMAREFAAKLAKEKGVRVSVGDAVRVALQQAIGEER